MCWVLRCTGQAGEYVKDEVVNFLVVSVSNAPDLHGYTVRRFYSSFKEWKGQVCEPLLLVIGAAPLQQAMTSQEALSHDNRLEIATKPSEASDQASLGLVVVLASLDKLVWRLALP